MAQNAVDNEIQGIVDETLYLDEFNEMIRDNLKTKKMGIAKGNPRVRVMNLWGISEPGIGKTQTIQKVAEEEGACYKYIPGANVFQGDLSGIPSIYTPEGKVKPEAIKLMINHYFPRIPEGDEINDPNMEYNKPGFLFVDEIMNMDPLVRGELLAYVDGNSKSVDGKEMDNFPPSWFLVMASNTEATVGDTFVELAANIRAKFNTYLLKPRPESFIHWMQTYNDPTFSVKGFHPAIVSYISENKNKDVIAPHFDTAHERNTASPRNWEALNVMMRVQDERIESGQFGKADEVKAARERFEKKVLTTLGNRVGEDFLKYYKFESETIDPKTFVEEDCSKCTKKIGSAEVKTFNKKSVSIRLMTMYRAIDYLDGLDKKVKESKDFKKYLKQIQDNVVWLISDRGEDFLVGFIDSLFSRFQPEGYIKLNDITPEFSKLAKKSILFQKS